MKRASAGRRTWSVYGSLSVRGDLPEEDGCYLANPADDDARVKAQCFFRSEPPSAPRFLIVPARGSVYLRYRDLIPLSALRRPCEFAVIFHADVPVLLQRLPALPPPSFPTQPFIRRESFS